MAAQRWSEFLELVWIVGLPLPLSKSCGALLIRFPISDLRRLESCIDPFSRDNSDGTLKGRRIGDEIRPDNLPACFAASGAQAAHFPKAEIFGGFQYTHLEGSGGAIGVNFAVNGNFNDWFGITADIGTAHMSESDANLDNYTVTFGPVVSVR